MATTQRHRPSQRLHLLEAVAPESWERPISPPHATQPDPVAALKASLNVTLARDMKKKLAWRTRRFRTSCAAFWAR